MAQYTGTVKWFNVAKGFGFLGLPNAPDVYVHYTAILTEGYKLLREGDEVEFDILEGPGGPRAANVLLTRRNA